MMEFGVGEGVAGGLSIRKKEKRKTNLVPETMAFCF